MSLLLHAIVPAEPVALSEPALHGIRAGAVVGFVSGQDADPAEHHRRITLLHERFSACLPARYGSRLEDAAALRRRLTDKQEQLYAALERVRGRCELAITGVWSRVPEIAEGGAGQRYLRQRQAQWRIAEQLADQIEHQVATQANEVQRKLMPRPGVALSLAVLVPREAAGAVLEHVTSIGEQDGVRILVNGPWPAYSFASLDLREE